MYINIYISSVAICGSIQPESKVAILMSFSKPAMTDGCGMAVHGGCEQDFVPRYQKEFLMKPARYIDIQTGALIPMERCLYECQELDKVVKKNERKQVDLQEGLQGNPWIMG